MTVAPEKKGPERGHCFFDTHVSVRPCWSCDAEIEDRFSCSHCSVIQTFLKETDYFSCFELGYRLQLDLDLLEKQYYHLSRRFHPDYYHQKTLEEQAISLENTALLTQAYRTLKDPLKRASYMIRLVEAAEEEGQLTPTEAPADLFEEIFEIQETLEEIRCCAESDAEEKASLLQTLKRALEKMACYQDKSKEALEALFSDWDRLESSRQQTSFSETQRSCLVEMKTILSHRAYVDRMMTEMRYTLSLNPVS